MLSRGTSTVHGRRIFSGRRWVVQSPNSYVSNLSDAQSGSGSLCAHSLQRLSVKRHEHRVVTPNNRNLYTAGLPDRHTLCAFLTPRGGACLNHFQ
jgi:hypothetical protein